MDYSLAKDVVIGAYASLQSMIGRRHPTVAWLTWGDVRIVKTAAVVDEEAEVVHLFAIVIRLRHEKCTDLHGTRVVVLDPSGDSNCLAEELLVGSGFVLVLRSGFVRNFIFVGPVEPRCSPGSHAKYRHGG